MAANLPDQPALSPTTIQRLSAGVLPAYAMLAAMQLELFTALSEGPASGVDVARKLGVEQEKLDDSRVGPPAAVFVNLTFLNIYDDGRAYTEAEYRTWLIESGCADMRRLTLADGTGILWATKAG